MVRALALPTAGYAKRLRFSLFGFRAKRAALVRLASSSDAASSLRQPGFAPAPGSKYACGIFANTAEPPHPPQSATRGWNPQAGSAERRKVGSTGAALMVRSLALPTADYAKRLRFSLFGFRAEHAA